MIGIVCCDIAGHGLGLQRAVGKIFIACCVAAVFDLSQTSSFVVDSCGSPPVDCGALADEAGGETGGDVVGEGCCAEARGGFEWFLKREQSLGRLLSLQIIASRSLSKSDNLCAFKYIPPLRMKRIIRQNSAPC